MTVKDILCRDYAAVAALAERMERQCAVGSPDRIRLHRIASGYGQLAVQLAVDDTDADLLNPVQQRAFL
jgi:hypothetical protein